MRRGYLSREKEIIVHNKKKEDQKLKSRLKLLISGRQEPSGQSAGRTKEVQV